MNMQWKLIVISTIVCSLQLASVSANDATADGIPPTSGTVTQMNGDADAYFVTKGDTYNKITGLLDSLPVTATGLQQPHYFQIEKALTDDYFYHVRAYTKHTNTVLGEYLVAKDDSCAWRLIAEKESTLIYGSADKLMEKVKVVVYPEKIPVDSYGIIRVHVPGLLPYDIKATCLNESVAKVSDKMDIEPCEPGTTDVLVEVHIGNTAKSFTRQIAVVNKQSTSRSSGRDEGRERPSINIGIGWESGGWHHHGGIGIGIGWGSWENADSWDD